MATEDWKYQDDAQSDDEKQEDALNKDPVDRDADDLFFDEDDDDLFVLDSDEEDEQEDDSHPADSPSVVADIGRSDQDEHPEAEDDLELFDDELDLGEEDVDLGDEELEFALDEDDFAEGEPSGEPSDELVDEGSPNLSDEEFVLEELEQPSLDIDETAGLTLSLETTDPDEPQGDDSELPDFDPSLKEDENEPDVIEVVADDLGVGIESDTVEAVGVPGSMPEVEELLFEEDLLVEKGVPSQETTEHGSAEEGGETFLVDEGELFDEAGGGWEGENGFQPEELGLEQPLPETSEQAALDAVFTPQEDAADDAPLSGGETHAAQPEDTSFGIPSGEERERWGDSSVFGSESSETTDWDQEDDEFTLVDDEHGLQSGTFSAAIPPRSSTDDGHQGDAEREIFDEGLEEDESYDEDADFDLEGEGEDEDFDPIYGSEANATAALSQLGFDDEEEEPDFRKHEEITPEGMEIVSGSETRVVAPPKRVWMKRFMAASMAASVLIIGLVAFLSLRPDLPFSQKMRRTLGLDPSTPETLKVASVSRPTVDTSYKLAGTPVVEKPVVAKGPKKAPRKVEPVSPDEFMKKSPYAVLLRGALAIAEGARKRTANLPPITPVKPVIAKTDPPVETPTQPVEPIPGTTQPGTTQPGTTQPRALPPGIAGGGATQPEIRGPEAGEEEEVVAKTGTARRGMSVFSQGIIRGTQALAQLRNGNFFVGRVQKISAASLILEVGKGELTFYPGELKKLIPLAESVARQIATSPDGYVRLKNKEKLLGKIIEEGMESVTLRSGKARIVLPRESILLVKKNVDPKLKLGKEETDWLDEEIPLPEAEDGPTLPEIEAETAKNNKKGAVRVKFNVPVPTPKLGTPTPAVPTRK